jgi:folate-binding protein YgfZ
MMVTPSMAQIGSVVGTGSVGASLPAVGSGGMAACLICCAAPPQLSAMVATARIRVRLVFTAVGLAHRGDPAKRRPCQNAVCHVHGNPMMDAITYVFTRPADVLRVTGADRVDLLHRLSTQDLRPLAQVGQMRQTLFTTQQGKLVDWTQLYALEDALWLQGSTSRAAELKAWVDKYTIMEDVATQDISPDIHELWLAGPDAARMVGLTQIPAEGTCSIRDGGVFCAGLPAYGPGVRALLSPDEAARLRQSSIAQGATLGDAATMEWLRLQAGVPSASAEFREQVNPLELRLTRHAVGWNKGCYIGQEVISRLDSYDKVARVLMGFECGTPVSAVAEGQAYKVIAEGKPVGKVTSWTNHGGGALGLALVKREAASPMAATLEDASGATIAVQLVTRPFFI